MNIAYYETILAMRSVECRHCKISGRAKIWAHAVESEVGRLQSLLAAAQSVIDTQKGEIAILLRANSNLHVEREARKNARRGTMVSCHRCGYAGYWMEGSKAGCQCSGC